MADYTTDNSVDERRDQAVRARRMALADKIGVLFTEPGKRAKIERDALVYIMRHSVDEPFRSTYPQIAHDIGAVGQSGEGAIKRLRDRYQIVTTRSVARSTTFSANWDAIEDGVARCEAEASEREAQLPPKAFANADDARVVRERLMRAIVEYVRANEGVRLSARFMMDNIFDVSVSKTTIYRMLSMLVYAGKLRREGGVGSKGFSYYTVDEATEPPAAPDPEEPPKSCTQLPIDYGEDDEREADDQARQATIERVVAERVDAVMWKILEAVDAALRGGRING